mmetsp:Transcript_597/g.1166  ORF Transcript_597/g.1166 Transcript_597/m.1166 type:complete len:206 (+) Transcript_597:248-865(+)
MVAGDGERLEDRVHFHPVALHARDAVHNFPDLGFDKKASLVAQQCEHSANFGRHVREQRLDVVGLGILVHDLLLAHGLCAQPCFVESRVHGFLVRRIPIQAQLLFVDYLVCLQNSAQQSFHLCLLHCPNFIELLRVRHLEVPIFPLKILKLFCDAPVFLREIHVLLLIMLVCLRVLRHQAAQIVYQSRNFPLLLVDRVVVLLVSL